MSDQVEVRLQRIEKLLHAYLSGEILAKRGEIWGGVAKSLNLRPISPDLVAKAESHMRDEQRRVDELLSCHAPECPAPAGMKQNKESEDEHIRNRA